MCSCAITTKGSVEANAPADKMRLCGVEAGHAQTSQASQSVPICNETLFLNLAHVRVEIAARVKDYNRERPRSSSRLRDPGGVHRQTGSAMACFAMSYGLRCTTRCFNRADAQQNCPALIRAGANPGGRQRSSITVAAFASVENMPGFTVGSGPAQPRREGEGTGRAHQGPGNGGRGLEPGWGVIGVADIRNRFSAAVLAAENWQEEARVEVRLMA